MERRSTITPRDLECMLCDETAEPKALPLSLLEEITDCFSDERQIGRGGFAVVYKGKVGNMAVAVKKMSNALMHEKEFHQEIECLMMAKHKNIVRFLGYCAVRQGSMERFNGKFVMADVHQRLLCFEYLPRGSLHEYITDTSCELQWTERYQIITEICQGLHYLHQKEIVHLDLKPANILLDGNLVPKIADFGLSRCFAEMQSRVITMKGGTFGYMAPEFCNHTEITYRHSYRLDIYSLGVIIIELLTGKKGYHAVDNVVESWSIMLGKSQSNAQLEQVRVCAEIGLECVDFNPEKRPDIQDIISRLDERETMDGYIQTGVITSQQMDSCLPNESGLLDASKKGGRELLDVHPLQLCFPFEPNKLIACQLNLTNNTVERVNFRCLPKYPKSFLNGLSRLHGTVMPNSSCIYIVTMEKHQQPPANMDTLAVILESWVSYRRSSVHKVTLKAVCEPVGKMMASEPIQPRIKVMYCRDGSLSEILSMDVHPTKPWILAAHGSGHVSIWNYETQERVTALRPVKEPAPCAGVHWMLSAKFIAREQWFVAGDGYGYIHVLSCTTMDEITEFKAHMGWVESLAIHPSLPLVLSASDDKLIKLWNWESGWSCIQIFDAHSRNVQQVKFNPLEGNTFASASLDGTVKIWTFSSPIPIATLDCDGDVQMCVDYFFPGGDRQYVVTGSNKGVARIWDLQTKKCIGELEGLQNLSGINVGVLDGVRGHPILMTSSNEYAVSLRNYDTYGYETMMDFKLDRVRGGFAYIKAIKSLVIGFDDGFAIMEIN